MTRVIVILALVLVLVAGGWYALQKSGVTGGSDEAAARALTEGFGRELQMVSLFAPDAAQTIAERYSPYVAQETLGIWMNDPTSAPGRLTSSPWPERIEITSIEKEGEDGYRVEGFIIEVANEGGGVGEGPTEAARRPVTLTVGRTDAGLRITSVVLGAYPGDGEWISTEPDETGLQWLYPRELPTTYISGAAPEGWPPKVVLEEAAYSCANGRMIGDREYCVTETSEGAAGSIYRTYEYASAYRGGTARVAFTLRFPQCVNYDDPERSACEREQESFDIDGLADRIAASIRVAYDALISYTDAGYEPASVTLSRGATVRFLNVSPEQTTWPASAVHPTHSLYPEKSAADCLGSSFDACRELAPGEYWDFTFSQAGEWRFHDHVHPSQTGVVNVTE